MADNRLITVVLAAGQGTRMRSKLPKILHPLGGKPLIDHILNAFTPLESGKTIAVVRNEHDQIVQHFLDRHSQILLAYQRDELGTGAAVGYALEEIEPAFEGQVLVVNGDVPFLTSDILQQSLEHHRAEGVTATLISTDVVDPFGYGRVVRNAAGDLVGVVEQKEATEEQKGITEINAGVYIFEVSLLRTVLTRLTTQNAQGEKYLTDVIGMLHQDGHAMSAICMKDSWRFEGVNDRVQLAKAQRQLNEMICEKWQRQGVSIQDPSTTWIDMNVEIESDVILLPSTYLRSNTTIGSGSVIGPETVLDGCSVGHFVRVRHSEATEASFDDHVSVGPYAYLRPGTRISEGAVVGAFCETKNAHIDRFAKLAHFNYVGDSYVGERTNVGAGAITANYDGVNKHRTHIGRDVRVGTHTVFVAPVSVGDGAYTAAGAVVRKDVPAGALAMILAPQRVHLHWVQTHRPGTHSAQSAQESEE